MKVILLLLLSSALSAQCIGHFNKTLIAKNHRCNSYEEVSVSYRGNTVDITIDNKLATYNVLEVQEYISDFWPHEAAVILVDDIVIMVIFDKKGLLYLELSLLAQDNSIEWQRS